MTPANPDDGGVDTSREAVRQEDTAAARRTLVGNARVVSALLAGCAFVSLTAGVALLPPLLAVCLAALFGLCALAITLRGQLPLVSPFNFVIATIVLVYCVRPVYLILRPNAETHAGPHDTRMFTMALALVVTFLLGFFPGFFLRVGPWLARRVPALPELWSTRRLWILQGLQLVCVAVLFAALFRVSGIPMRAAFEHPAAFRAVTSAGGMFYISGTVLWVMWSVFFLALVRVLQTGVRWPSALALGAMCAVFVVLTLPFGARGFVLGPLVGIVYLVDAAGLRRRLRVAALTPVLIAVVVFIGAYAVYRDVETRAAGPDYLDEALQRELGWGVIDRFTTRLDAFDFLVWTIDAFPTQDQSYLAGRSLIDLVAQPIPRSLMPSKPSQTSAYLMDIFVPNYDRTFTPEFGLVTELYINGWVPGVLIGALLWGIAMRALEDYTDRHRTNPSFLYWYSSVASLPMGWMLAGVNSFATILLLMNSTFTAIVLYGLVPRSRS